MQSLSELNIKLVEVLKELQIVAVEDETSDELVLSLHVMVGERQLLLVSVFENASIEDAIEMEKQLGLTKVFEAQAKTILKHRQTLLHAGRKSKRQLNVYKAIDTN
ncbi:hypothetical protein L2729_07415 [Shewanella gelidimarina]|uniref:hypothetical protein n=1 Tax=Shewanella gelidimarina TaxID=56813 RepID=UPI00200E5757|nr:hypothetical protein [Shewanella gelidimarina]MCL1057830.1 hypothetical protein [Shewanella gelidimarina]